METTVTISVKYAKTLLTRLSVLDGIVYSTIPAKTGNLSAAQIREYERIQNRLVKNGVLNEDGAIINDELCNWYSKRFL